MIRPVNRHRNRSLNRRLTRHTTRMLGGAARPRPPNHLADAFCAFTRAIRAHRRLMKLAPERFDVGVVQRLEREREEKARRMAKWATAIAKAYGVSEAEVLASAPFTNDQRCKNGATMVQNKLVWDGQRLRRVTRRTEQAIEREFAEWELWLALGREALARYKRPPCRDMSLSQLARLMEIASILGRLSTGLETRAAKPLPPPTGDLTFEEALKKAYGDPGEKSPDN